MLYACTCLFIYMLYFSQGLSSVSMVPCVEARPSTLGQSQSVMNISRMSPKAETKKRRAPAPPGAPTPTFGHYSFEGYQVRDGAVLKMLVGSLNTQRLWVSQPRNQHPKVTVTCIFYIGATAPCSFVMAACWEMFCDQLPSSLPQIIGLVCFEG